MKNMKKILAIILSLSLVLSMSVPSLVFAANQAGAAGDSGRTVKVYNEDPGHIYEAYQIFKGSFNYTAFDVSEMTKGTDSNDNVTYTDATSGKVYTVNGTNLLDPNNKVVANRDSADSLYWYAVNEKGARIIANDKKTLTNVTFGDNLGIEKVAPANTKIGTKDISGKTFVEALNFVWPTLNIETSTDPQTYAENVLEGIGSLGEEGGPTLAEILSYYLKDGPYASADTPTPKSDTNPEGQYYPLTGLADGYYFIKDQDNSLTGDKDKKAYTDFILRVVMDSSVQAKADVPTIDKKIVDPYDPKTGKLMPVYGIQVKDEVNSTGERSVFYWEALTDPKEIYQEGHLYDDTKLKQGVKRLYQKCSAEGENTGWYYVVDANGNYQYEENENHIMVRKESQTAALYGDYPVLIDDSAQYEKEIMQNEFGKVFALRVDENTASMGQWVTYEIPVTIPKMEGYNAYHMQITDNLSPGLTLPGAAEMISGDGAGLGTTAHPFKVEVVYSDGSREELAYSSSAWDGKVTNPRKSYGLQVTKINTAGEYKDGTKVELVINDAIQYQWKEISDEHPKNAVQFVITYDAQVNGEAVIGNNGNPNEVSLKYSRNPNEEYDGTKNVPTGTTGDTPKEEVRTYVTELLLKKVTNGGTADETALAGAEFDVTGTRHVPTITYAEEFVKYVDGNNNGEDDNNNSVVLADVKYYKLKDGTYTDKAPTWDVTEGDTTTYGNYVDYWDWNYTDDNKTPTGNTVDDTGVPSTRYTSEADVKAAIKPKYYLHMKTTVDYTTETFTRHLVVGDSGYLDLSGLGAGTYTFKETKAPEGYNLLRDDIIVEITFDCDDDALTNTGTPDGTANFRARYKIGENGTWETLTLQTTPIHIFRGDPNAPSNDDEVPPEGYTPGDEVTVDKYFVVKVNNKQGSELPETGGIGTKIFYTLGAILVLLAGILLITRRRMAHQK